MTAQHEVIGAGSVTDGDGVLRGWLRKWSPTGQTLATSVAEPDQMLKAKALGLLEIEGDVIVAGHANTFEQLVRAEPPRQVYLAAFGHGRAGPGPIG